MNSQLCRETDKKGESRFSRVTEIVGEPAFMGNRFQGRASLEG